jgi:ferredoxin
VAERADGRYFAFAAATQSPKAVLFPPRLLLWSGEREGTGFTVRAPQEEPPRLALLGVRSCDLRAIAVHDQVLAARGVRDEDYVARRAAVLVVAIACAEPAGTCFCVSAGIGPVPGEGHDLCLTELLDERGHRFLVQPGTAAGQEVLADVPTGPAMELDLAAARRQAADAAGRMGRSLDTDGVRDLLYDNVEHPRWEATAQRCLACGNCTLACPTCFCTSVDDETDLTGENARRWRVWDSCFTEDFSYLHGGSVRSSTASRYRQWLTHKLAAWQDQFGTSGCVGCGRCITWCPVGIDLTEEVAAIRARPLVSPATGEEA